MPFTSSAPNFFGRFGAQTSPTNFGNPMEMFSQADKTRGAMPNLFTTIQAVRANELERQTKQTQISKVLQELAIQQQMAPYELAYKQAQANSLPVETAYRQTQVDAAPTELDYKKAQAKKLQVEADNLNKPMEEGYKRVAGKVVLDRDSDAYKRWKEDERKRIVNNPSIDVDTQKSIAAVRFAQPRIENVFKFIDSGALGDDKTFKKFTNEIRVLGAGPTLRYTVEDGSPLEGLISEVNALRVGGFGIAGAAYTDTEREIIEYGLDPRGKSSQQIKQDMNIVQDLMIEKARSGTMGLDEARNIVGQFKTFRESGNKSNGTPVVGGMMNGKEIVSVEEVEE